MIKKLKTRFVIFNLVVISIVFIIIGGFILINNKHVVSSGGHTTLQCLVLTCVVFLIIAFVASLFLAKVALEPIKEVWKKQLDFTAEASRELRTSLAVIQTNLEIILENEEDDNL